MRPRPHHRRHESNRCSRRHRNEHGGGRVGGRAADLDPEGRRCRAGHGGSGGDDPGTVDGRYGEGTALAVMTFQKVSGLPRTGVADTVTLQALVGTTDPAPLVPTGAPTRVEVDMARQVLLVWIDGQLTRIHPVSTGNGKR